MSNTMEPVEVAVVGGGPAGLMCALRAAQREMRVVLLEKNDFPGKKLLISGSGRCNVTHSDDIERFLTKYGAREKERFVKPALFHFTNRDLCDFLTHGGVRLTEDEKGKLFPESQNSRDVLDAVVDAVKKANVRIVTSANVLAVERLAEENAGGNKSDKDAGKHDGFHIRSTKGDFRARVLVIATGGKSYPATGSTGDGFAWAASLGHDIVPPRPSLSAVFVKHYPFSQCSGIAIPDVEITLLRRRCDDGERCDAARQRIRVETGPVLMTHKNFSGPGILDFSRFFRKGDVLRFNWLGTCSGSEFERRFLDSLAEHGKRSLGNALRVSGLPGRFVHALLEIASVSPEKQTSRLEKHERKKIVSVFTGFEREIEELSDFSGAMCTAGGVSLREVDRRNLMSRIVPNLYFCGEVLDVDGNTGGYNLQFAFSSGVLVGDAIVTEYYRKKSTAFLKR